MIPKDCKRLAEVDFPIAEVSRHAAREKSIRHGHPSTLRLWWARRHAVPSRPAQPAVPPGTTGLGDRAWRMERDGRGWIMNLKGFSWEEPQGLGLKRSEDKYLQTERRRRALPDSGVEALHYLPLLQTDHVQRQLDLLRLASAYRGFTNAHNRGTNHN